MIFHECPFPVLELLSKHLQEHGVMVVFHSKTEGEIDSVGGRLKFRHTTYWDKELEEIREEELEVTVLENRYNVPESFLFTGIKQLIVKYKEEWKCQQKSVS